MAKDRYPLERPRTRAKVIALALEGLSDGAIAERVSTPTRSVTRQAVHAFRKRHMTSIAPAVAEIERQASDYAIASKVARIGELQALYAATHDWQEEHGLGEVTKRFDPRSGELIGESVTFASGIVAAKRGILKDVAEELGQLDKGAVNVGIQVLIRTVAGYDVEELG